MSQHEDHGPLFTKILIALGILTAVTVALSRFDLGGKAINITVGLIVAVAKATLVVMIFMHLKWEKRVWLGMVLFPVLLVMIIIFANLPDTGMSQEHLTPAVKSIPHAGHGSAPAKH
jgi:cytochrome c oxidase subunit 4